MFDIRSEHVYIELVKIWNKYPNIKTEYLKERDKKRKKHQFVYTGQVQQVL